MTTQINGHSFVFCANCPLPGICGADNVCVETDFLDGGADDLSLPNFTCPTCGKVSHSQQSRAQHVKAKHSALVAMKGE